jgi:hypothetical protein
LPPALKARTACGLETARTAGMNALALAAKSTSSSAALMLQRSSEAQEYVLLRVGAVLLHSRRPPSKERAKNLRRERKILRGLQYRAIYERAVNTQHNSMRASSSTHTTHNKTTTEKHSCLI